MKHRRWSSSDSISRKKKKKDDIGIGEVVNLQQTKTQNHRQPNPLPQRHLQLQRQRNRQRIRQQIGKDINSRICKIKRININTIVTPRLIPRRRNRRALEDRRQHIARRLAGHHTNHDDGKTTQGAVAEAHVQGQGGDFDEAEAGVVKEGGEPDDLGVGDESVGAVVFFDVDEVAA